MSVSLERMADCDALADHTRAWVEHAAAVWFDEGPVEESAMAFSNDGFDDQSFESISGALDSDGASRSAPSTLPASPPAVSGDAAADSPSDELVGTNNQELGVEESDIVGIDDQRIVWITNGVLHVAMLDDDVTIDGTLDLSSRGPAELFLRGDTVLVLGGNFGMMPLVVPRAVDGGVAFDDVAVPGSAGSASSEPFAGATIDTVQGDPAPEPGQPRPLPAEPQPEPFPTEPLPVDPPPVDPLPVDPLPVEPDPMPGIMPVGPERTSLTIVSIAEPSAPTVVAQADVEGSLVTAREIDGVASVVVQSWPNPFSQGLDVMPGTELDDVLDSISGEQMLPLRWDGDEATPLSGCDDVMVMPLSAAPDPGLGRGWVDEPASVTVLRVGDDLADLAPVTIQGAAETVYASTTAVYVAATRWDQQAPDTVVHRFGLDGDGPAAHTGSGAVPGRLLNQFALSERNGFLRVVTTVDEIVEFFTQGASDEMVGAVAPMPITEGRLTVLDTDGALDEVGHVEGLGPNEEVQSVRFIEDLAYVVTFRQTDPLYAIDLSDPTNPTVLGELKITGFSEYLHPVGDGLLLGVGREVDENTGIDEGMKVSLFDISNPTALAEVDRFVLPNRWSQVNAGDHRAFTWDPARNRAIIPTDTEALVVQVVAGTLDTIAGLAHPSQFGQVSPHRSRIHNGTIWTISSVGLGGTNADAPDGVRMVSR